MRKFTKIPYLSVVSVFLMFVSCKQVDSNKETILKGTTTILVDETLKPLFEDQIAVFQSDYKAKIVLDAKSEKEVSKSFLQDTSRIVVLSRKLNVDENKYFDHLNIIPKTTKIAIDAIALIRNKSNKDTLIALQDIIYFLQGHQQNAVKGLVFDNPNSSTVRYMSELANLESLPVENVYSFSTNEEVVKFVSENDGMIGVVGVNWLSQPTSEMKKYMINISVLNVKGQGKDDYFAPTQNNLAEGTYPLARDLYIINCQGYSGLGMGFSSFVAGDKGQRIILKSGLLPVRMPSRKVTIESNSESE